MKSTVEDVAKRAGVSTGTVSNALTGKRPVAEATRNRILAAMDELGYHPNLLARGLVNGRSHVISVVIKELSDLGFYGYSSVLTGIQREAGKLGYSLMLHFVNSTAEAEIFTILNQIRSRRIDGVIWAIHEIKGNRDWIKNFHPENYPPILYLNMHPSPNLNVISIDNQAGAILAVSHLVEQGCRKVGIITGPIDWWESQSRLEGWQKALHLAGLEPDPAFIAEGNWLAESGRAGAETLLDRFPDLDAIFACNDSMALGVIHAACSRGLVIPDDLLLAGFDNTPEAATYWPPLTSVGQNLLQCGQLAVEELHHIIESEAGKPFLPNQRVLMPELFIRRSTKR